MSNIPPLHPGWYFVVEEGYSTLYKLHCTRADTSRAYAWLVFHVLGGWTAVRSLPRIVFVVHP